MIYFVPLLAIVRINDVFTECVWDKVEFMDLNFSEEGESIALCDARMSTKSFRNSVCIFTRSGISLIHGVHQVAQRLRMTTLFLHCSESKASPCRSVNLILLRKGLSFLICSQIQMKQPSGPI